MLNKLNNIYIQVAFEYEVTDLNKLLNENVKEIPF